MNHSRGAHLRGIKLTPHSFPTSSRHLRRLGLDAVLEPQPIKHNSIYASGIRLSHKVSG